MCHIAAPRLAACWFSSSTAVSTPSWIGQKTSVPTSTIAVLATRERSATYFSVNHSASAKKQHDATCLCAHEPTPVAGHFGDRLHVAERLWSPMVGSPTAEPARVSSHPARRRRVRKEKPFYDNSSCLTRTHGCRDAVDAAPLRGFADTQPRRASERARARLHRGHPRAA